MKRAHVSYYGNVQGVGFRYTTVNIARGFDVTGYVKNLPNGQVEVVAEGQEIELKRFFTEIKSKMSSFIRDEQIGWQPANGQFVDFSIRY